MTSNWIRYSLLLILTFIFLSCASSPHKTFEKVKVGMDKDSVLDLMGSPQKTRRWKSKDQWVYTFYKDDTEISKQLTFDTGKLISIEEYSQAPTAMEQLEDASSWQQYESAVKKMKKNSSNTDSESQPTQ
jgi:outer membrane protein assembly factor BamE (lipoprotein component of BamABCDE complex)